MDAYFYKPTNGEPVSIDAAYVVNTGASIPAAADWAEYVIDMSKYLEILLIS